MTAPPLRAPEPVPAPVPPGRLGESIGQQALLDYQVALHRWLEDRRTELDRLDRAAQAARDAQAVTGDVVLAMSMWESVRSRAEELRTLWDSGRADALARERMSRVIWGRLDGAPVPGDPTAATSTVSLAEATTLADALVRQLRTRLAFDPDQADVTARLRAVRASLVRSGDLVRDGEPEAEAVARVRGAWERVTADSTRGADVTGPLGELEVASARVERDAIVAAARRHEAQRDHARATSLAQQLEAREAGLAELVERCRREIATPPRLAVPDVSRLGDVPTEAEALAAYLTRLEAVARAMDTVEDAYTTPLRTRASLRFRLARLTERAAGNGRDASPTVRAALAEASDAVAASPCDVTLAEDLVDLADVVTAPLKHGRSR
ncbi:MULTISPECIES: hypothetical protein [Miniimonas]|uniref:hypothetical protein n=1 Tax=Miniimonas TaxID=947525 RepID=UPI001F4660C0|nr:MULTISPECIES: hypothetical protein [Miniimonas]